MPTVLIQGRLAVIHEHRLRARLDASWRILSWLPGRDPLDSFAPMLAEADAVVGGAIPVTPWPPSPRLKIYQISWTGHEFTAPDRVPNGVAVCNVHEHESAIAEYVLLAMLEWQIGLRRMDAEFRDHGWGGHPVATGEVHGEVRGATVGIVGHGHIGREVAIRARAFGMGTVGVRRSRRLCPPELDWLGTMDRLDELLAISDFVVVACDLNAESRQLIDAGRLARMKPTGVIINVARGAVIDEAALYTALKERRIGGAVIDVWWNYQDEGGPEVWPANHPFQELDNVICSAHQCAWTEAMIERRWDVVAANLNRVVRGEPPVNLLFHGTQD